VFFSSLLFASVTYQIIVILARTYILNPGERLTAQQDSHGSCVDIWRASWI